MLSLDCSQPITSRATNGMQAPPICRYQSFVVVSTAVGLTIFDLMYVVGPKPWNLHVCIRLGLH